MSESAPNKADLVAAARAAAQRRMPRPLAAVEGVRGFDSHPDFRDSQRMKQVGAMLGVSNPFFRVHEGHAGALTRIDGQDLVNFASYDYCGLNADPRVAEAAKTAIDRYGVSPSGSRLVAGSRPVHDQLEAGIARHYGTEAALCFVSGHATNVSTIGQVMGEGDLILHDALCHNSILVGVKLSGAARRAFPHNDMAALEALLVESRGLYRNALIVTEGLFSMDGDVPPLADLVALKQRFGCWLMVDEAHALGCVGPRGAGSFEAAGVPPAHVDIWMGTLSKTLAATGGYIAGSAALIDLLRAHAAGFVYSVALAPALAAAADCALRLLEQEPERVLRLQALSTVFLEAAKAAGLATGTAGPYGIMPVLVGDSLLAAKLSERLLARGINVLPVIFPAVPMQGARLRFFLSALHDEEQVKAAVDATVKELGALRGEGFGTSVPPALMGL